MKKNLGFTILEMMLVLLVISIILLLIIPNIAGKQASIKEKGCLAQIEVVNAQILLYEIDRGVTPTHLNQLVEGGYISAKQTICATGRDIVIIDGHAQ